MLEEFFVVFISEEPLNFRICTLWYFLLNSSNIYCCVLQDSVQDTIFSFIPLRLWKSKSSYHRHVLMQSSWHFFLFFLRSIYNIVDQISKLNKLVNLFLYTADQHYHTSPGSSSISSSSKKTKEEIQAFSSTLSSVVSFKITLLIFQSPKGF